MQAMILSGWKWLWIPLLALVVLGALMFLASIAYFVYLKYIRPANGLLMENLDKEEALPPAPRPHS